MFQQLYAFLKNWVLSLWGWMFQGKTSKSLGDRGEKAAERFLKQKGYIILYRKQQERLGEIDLIAVDGETIVFIEVKTRSSLEHGLPVEAINQKKLRRLIHGATQFLSRHKLLEHAARLDAVSVYWPEEQKKPHMEHYENISLMYSPDH